MALSWKEALCVFVVFLLQALVALARNLDPLQEALALNAMWLYLIAFFLYIAGVAFSSVFLLFLILFGRLTEETINISPGSGERQPAVTVTAVLLSALAAVIVIADAYQVHEPIEYNTASFIAEVFYLGCTVVYMIKADTAKQTNQVKAAYLMIAAYNVVYGFVDIVNNFFYDLPYVRDHTMGGMIAVIFVLTIQLRFSLAYNALLRALYTSHRGYPDIWYPDANNVKLYVEEQKQEQVGKHATVIHEAQALNPSSSSSYRSIHDDSTSSGKTSPNREDAALVLAFLALVGIHLFLLYPSEYLEVHMIDPGAGWGLFLNSCYLGLLVVALLIQLVYYLLSRPEGRSILNGISLESWVLLFLTFVAICVVDVIEMHTLYSHDATVITSFLVELVFLAASIWFTCVTTNLLEGYRLQAIYRFCLLNFAAWNLAYMVYDLGGDFFISLPAYVDTLPTVGKGFLVICYGLCTYGRFILAFRTATKAFLPSKAVFSAHPRVLEIGYPTGA